MQHSGAAYDELFRRLHELDSKLQYIEKREVEATRRTSAQMSKIEEDCAASHAAVARLELKLSKDVERLEEVLSRDVAAEAKARSDTEQRLRRLLEDESAAIRSLMTTQEHTRAAQSQQWLLSAEEQLNQQKRTMDLHVDTFAQQVEYAAKSTSSEAQRIEDVLSAFQAKREASELQLLRVLEETCVQLHQEIVDERLERAESHKRLERLLLESINQQWTRT